MKKIYIKPVAEFELVEPNDVICASKDTIASASAEWGDNGQFAPGEWMNEGHARDTDWPSVGIQEDEKDLFSR